MKEGESEGGLRRATPAQQASVCVATNADKVVQLSATTAPSANVQNLGGPGSGGPEIGSFTFNRFNSLKIIS